METVRYAIFDMDGTLVDSMGYWIGLVKEALNLLPKDIELPPRAAEEIPTMGIRRAREYLASFGIDASDAFNEERGALLMKAHYENDVGMKPGARELLEEFKSRGVRMVIATLTPRPLMEICLEKHGLTDYFEAFYTPEEYPEGKKGTRIFFDIMERFGARAEDIWLFEDSLYSVKTAKTLSLRIAVTEEETQAKNAPVLYELADAYFTHGFTKRLK